MLPMHLIFQPKMVNLPLGFILYIHGTNTILFAWGESRGFISEIGNYWDTTTDLLLVPLYPSKNKQRWHSVVHEKCYLLYSFRLLPCFNQCRYIYSTEARTSSLSRARLAAVLSPLPLGKIATHRLQQSQLKIPKLPLRIVASQRRCHVHWFHLVPSCNHLIQYNCGRCHLRWSVQIHLWR